MLVYRYLLLYQFNTRYKADFLEIRRKTFCERKRRIQETRETIRNDKKQCLFQANYLKTSPLNAL